MAAFASAVDRRISSVSRPGRSSWVHGRPWSRVEEDELRDAASSLTIPMIATNLNRSEASVRLKLRNLGYDFRDLAGFKVKDLAGVLGVTIRQVRRWRQKGYLRGVNGRITEESFARFCRVHVEKIPYDSLGWDTRLWLRGFGYRSPALSPIASIHSISDASVSSIPPALARSPRSTASNT